MSDFLNKFSRDNYSKMLEEENTKEESKKSVIEPHNSAKNKEDKKQQIDNTDTEIEVFLNVETIEKASEPQTENNVKEEDLLSQTMPPTEKVQEHLKDLTNNNSPTSRRSIGIEELTEVDTTYQKKQQQKFILIGVTVVLVLATIGGSFFLFNRVSVPNFVTKNISEAKTWALKNRIELDISEEYNLENEAQIIFEQGKAPNKHILKGSVFSLKVSKGADPEEKITLPDFTTMKTTAIESWKKEKVAENVKIIKEFNETEENGKFLRMEFKNVEMTTADYRRKDGLTIYVSKGKETFEKNIEVPDFKDKPKAEIETWAKTNDVIVYFEEVASEKTPVDMVIEQSIAPKEKIAKKSEITIKLSTGKSVQVPWFGNYTFNQAMQAAPGLNVQVIQEYHNEVAYGDVIWQSVSAGTWLSEKDNTSVDVYYSLGRPYISDLTSMTEEQLPAYFYEFRDKGANITYTIHYVSGGPRGTVQSASKNLEYVWLNTHVDVYVYR